MAQLTVRINGYTYPVGCEDGQEAHLLAMATEVENRVASIKALGGQSGEARLLALAALLMADELHDLKAERDRMSKLLPHKPDRALARNLNKLADRAEEIATAIDAH